MTTNVIGTDTHTTPIVVPANGEAVDGAGLVVTAQGLANQIEYVRQRTRGIATAYTIEIPLNYPISNQGSRFTSHAGGWQQTDITDGGPLNFRIDRGNYTKINEIHVLCKAGLTHTAFPVNKASIGLFRFNCTPGDPSYGSSYAAPHGGAYTLDPSATFGASELVHLISKTAMNYTVDPYELLNLTLYGESGLNSKVNFTYHRAWMIVTP